jgi:hypothetical protein
MTTPKFFQVHRRHPVYLRRASCVLRPALDSYFSGGTCTIGSTINTLTVVHVCHMWYVGTRVLPVLVAGCTRVLLMVDVVRNSSNLLE